MKHRSTFALGVWSPDLKAGADPGEMSTTCDFWQYTLQILRDMKSMKDIGTSLTDIQRTIDSTSNIQPSIHVALFISLFVVGV